MSVNKEGSLEGRVIEAVAGRRTGSLGFIGGHENVPKPVELSRVRVVAGVAGLRPGTAVQIRNGEAFNVPLPWTEGTPMGVVDPFLPHTPRPGERFWCLLWPMDAQLNLALGDQSRHKSEVWLRKFCDMEGLDFIGLFEMANNIMNGTGDEGEIGNGGDWRLNLPSPPDAALDDIIFICDEMGCSCYIPNKFWEHMKVVTGIDIPLVLANRAA